MKRNALLFLIFFFLLIFNACSFASNNEQSSYKASVSKEPQQFAGILASHNTVRAKFNQVSLTWSDSLAGYAQQWVDHLAKTRNCAMIHRPNYDNEVESKRFLQVNGENLFWASAEVFENGTQKLQHFTAKEVVKAWAVEENYYDYQSNSCEPGQQCGHFTQMVWHESRQVGCAKAICPDKSQIWACNYYPRGNYIGEKPY